MPSARPGRHPARRPDPAEPSTAADVSGQSDPTNGPQPASRPSGLRRLLKVVRPLVAVLVVAALVWTVVDQWRPLSDQFARLSVVSLVVASLGALLSVLGQMLCWRELLADLGNRLPLAAAGRVFFLGQLGKYLPGSVWPVVAQMELARDLRVPRARTATTVLLFMLLNVVSAVAVAGLVLPFTLDDRAVDAAEAGERWAWVGRWHWAFLVLLLPLLLLLPTVLNRLTAIGLRIIRRPAAETELTAAGIARALGWTVAEWVAAGVMLAALLSGFGDAVSLPLAIGAFALAWGIGFVVVVVPAGAGVREAVLVVLLSGSVGHSTAFAAALATRLLMTVADGLWALVLVPHALRGRSAMQAAAQPVSGQDASVQTSGAAAPALDPSADPEVPVR